MTEEEIQKITLFMERFLEHITTERYSSLTVQGYRQHLNVFREFLRVKMRVVDLHHGRDFVPVSNTRLHQPMEGKPLSLNTQCGRLVAVRIFSATWPRGEHPERPAGGLELPVRKGGSRAGS